MKAREKKKKWILYPEDAQKVNWDLFITLILLISCVITPLRIAFGENEEPLGWEIINWTIDSLFFIDIGVVFSSAYYDEDFVIIEDRKLIAASYCKSWLMIDALAIIPFDKFINAFSNNKDE